MISKVINFIKSPLTLVAGISLLATFVIAFLVAFLALGFGAPSILFWPFVVLAIGIQFILFSIFNAPLQQPIQYIPVEPEPIVASTRCAVCDVTNEVPIKWGQENKYECVSCKVSNILLISTKSTQSTIIISNPKVV